MFLCMCQCWGEPVQCRKSSGLWRSLGANSPQISERRWQHRKSHTSHFSVCFCLSALSLSVFLLCLLCVFNQFSLLKNWSLQLVGHSFFMISAYFFKMIENYKWGTCKCCFRRERSVCLKALTFALSETAVSSVRGWGVHHRVRGHWRRGWGWRGTL